MNQIVYYCNYVENGAPVCNCGTDTKEMAMTYAKNLSRVHGCVTVTAHYMNGGIKKIGFAEKGQFYKI